jgi:subtilisin family serine protease
MPKGVGWLVGILIVVCAAAGGWYAYDSAQKKKALEAADAKRIELQGQQRPSSAPAPLSNQTFAPQQFGTWGSKPPEMQFVPGEIIVSNAPQTFADAVGGLGYAVLETIRLNNLNMTVYRLRVPNGVTVEQARQNLAARFPGVTFDANHEFQPQAGPSDFAAKLPRALAGWSGGSVTCGNGIRLGMIDAAVDVNHPALKGQNIEFRSFHPQGSGPGPADHGTAVAAIMVGRPEWGGLLPGATLKAGNMFQTNEVGAQIGSAVGLMKSIDWLLGENLQAINFSVAGADNKIVREVIDKAKSKKIAMVAAAGNWGTDQRPAYPAAYDEVMAITAFGDKGVLYSHANYGPYIDFAAPGVDVFVAAPGGVGKLESGTSFASPFVTVLAALEVARGRSGDPNTIIGVLNQTVVDLGPKGRDPQFGWGYVAKQPAC